MKINRKIFIPIVGVLVGISGFFATASYAGYYPHGGTWGYHHYRHVHYPYYHSAVIAASVVGAVVVGGIVAGTIIHENNHLCRQVYYTRNCGYTPWGALECDDIRHIHYFAC